MAKNSQTINLNHDFWRWFAKNIWEQKEFSAKNVKTPLLNIDQNQIFSMLLKFSDRCRKLKQLDGLKLFVDGHRLYDQEVLQILPVKSDRNLQSYHQRISQIYSDYCLVCDELLQVSAKHWDTLTEFTRALYNQVGFPNRFAEMGLYLGNYRKTPFGVHVDNCGVFSFPVVGTKKFRIWSEDIVNKNPALVRTHSYAKYKKSSKLLVAKPGDMTYWPSSAWHIAESDGSFSATWSLGVWVDQPHQESLTMALQPLLQSKLGSSATAKVTSFKSLYKSNGQLQTLPPIFQQSAKKMKAISKKEILDYLCKSWIQTVSKQGLKTSPVFLLANPLTLKDTIHLRSGKQPVLWTTLKSTRQQVFAFNGMILETSPSKELLNLINTLNKGKPCIINKFLKNSGKKRALAVLNQLNSVGAFVSL